MALNRNRLPASGISAHEGSYEQVGCCVRFGAVYPDQCGRTSSVVWVDVWLYSAASGAWLYCAAASAWIHRAAAGADSPLRGFGGIAWGLFSSIETGGQTRGPELSRGHQELVL